jgi:hypothetical protein
VFQKLSPNEVVGVHGERERNGTEFLIEFIDEWKPEKDLDNCVSCVEDFLKLASKAERAEYKVELKDNFSVAVFSKLVLNRKLIIFFCVAFCVEFPPSSREPGQG